MIPKPLIEAWRGRDLDSTKKYVLERIDSINAPFPTDRFHSTILHQAVSSNWYELLEWLVTVPGIDLNVGYTDNPITALSMAINSDLPDSYKMVYLLLEHGANLDRVDYRTLKEPQDLKDWKTMQSLAIKRCRGVANTLMEAAEVYPGIRGVLQTMAAEMWNSRLESCWIEPMDLFKNRDKKK